MGMIIPKMGIIKSLLNVPELYQPTAEIPLFQVISDRTGAAKTSQGID